MGLAIITAEERLKEQKGVKALIIGPHGVGKTSLLRTMDAAGTLFLDMEAGDIAVSDVAVDQLRPTTWPECRDLACFLAGPDTNAPADAIYGQEHYAAVCEKYGGPEALDKYHTYFIDSLTVAGRHCFNWSQQQPEAFNSKGEKDTRGAYGLHGREIVAWVTRLQQARSKNVIFVCLLNEVKDDFGRTSWELQIEGKKAGNEVPGIVDEVLTLAMIRPDDGDPYRKLVTSPENPWGYPAKDRSGLLEAMEAPDLGAIINKLTQPKMMEAA